MLNILKENQKRHLKLVEETFYVANNVEIKICSKKEYNQNMLKYLKEKQKIREEKEAYEEAFYKLSNEEQIIIRKVEGELIQVDKMDRLNKYKLGLEQREKEKIKRLEQREKEEIKREKEEIKRLTKLIETYPEFMKYNNARIKVEFPELSTRERFDKAAKLSAATGVVGVLAYVGLTIITR